MGLNALHKGDTPNKQNHPLLKLGLVQLTSIDDVEINSNNIRLALEHIKQNGGADIIVFPENSLYFRLDIKQAIQSISAQDPFFVELCDYCRQNQNHIFLTTPLQEKKQTVNGTLWINPQGQVKLVYRKIHLFDVQVVGLPDIRESLEFSPGQAPQIVELYGWKIGLSICYDLRFSELFYYYAKKEVDLIFIPSAFLVATGRVHWEPLLKARAIESQCFVAAPGQGGVHKNQQEGRSQSRETWGHSMIVDPWGLIQAEIKDASPQSSPFSVLLQTLDYSLIQKTRRQIPMKNHRKLNIDFGFNT